MEGNPMVSYSEGSMNCLLYKLTNLKIHPPGIQDLKQDLMNLKEKFSHKVARRQEMDFKFEAWMNIVRELVFDIEDWADQKLDMGDQQLDIEEQVAKFKAEIKYVCELCERHHLVLTDDLHDRRAVLPSRSGILFGGKTVLVGGDKPTDELVKLLTGENMKRLRVVSIVGMEGLGKTTLAKEIYRKLQIDGQFDCWASVSLGKRPSMRNTLNEILRQLKLCEKKRVKAKPNPYARGEAPNMRKLATMLSDYIDTKRYFILVDGIWSIQAWKIIDSALPDKNRGSRVLTTTSMSNIAKFCSVYRSDIYHMEPLAEKDSMKLLYLESTQQREYFPHRDTTDMVKMCGGMPLAITVTSGLLATVSEKVLEPAILERTLLSSVEQFSMPELMTKILHISYAALSLPLQSCLLYLSAFRENYTIKKDRLIRLWIAEGYIPREDKERRGEDSTGREEERITEGYIPREDKERRGEETTGREDETLRGEENLWETGESYFNQLVMRRLIQPVFNYNDDQAVGCTVHSAILDFIKSLSRKGNFVTAGGAHLNIYTVRRFSLDCYDDQDEDEDGDGTLASIAANLFRVRSVTVLGDIEGMDGRSALAASGKIGGGSVLPCFNLLRVLDLEGTVSLGNHHLKGIGGLILLNYLGVAGTDIDKLPKEIGKLEQLETLDLRHTKLSTLPESVFKLKRLAHLLVDYTVKLPSGIQKMQRLQEVSTIGVDKDNQISVVELLRYSERLRVLGIRLDRGKPYEERVYMEVASSTKLTSLTLYCPYEYLLLRPPTDQLRRFELKISAPILTEMFSFLPLVSVTHLDIGIVELDHRIVSELGKLPNLVLIKLVSTGIMNSESKQGCCWKRKQSKKRAESSRTVSMAVVVDCGFNCLKVFSFTCRSGGTKLQFTPSAMKELKRLSLGFSAHETLSLHGNFSFGIEHLSALTQVHVTIDCKSAAASEVKSAEYAIRAQIGELRDLTIEFTDDDKKAAKV